MSKKIIRKYFGLLCMALLVLTNAGIIDEAHAFKGPWVIYESGVHVHILVETSPKVPNDFDHRHLHFDYDDSCNEPNWGYNYEDITAGGGRRLWTMWAHNLTPGCRYDYTFTTKIKDLFDDNPWTEVDGVFYAGASGVPDQGSFYALGDQRYMGLTSELPINDVAEEVLNNYDFDSPAFLINTGDMAYYGGYSFNDHDNWTPYFNLYEVQKLFAAMPVFTTPGNHDIDFGHGVGTGDAWNYTRYFPLSVVTHDPRLAYYDRIYGQFQIISLTSYPMEKASAYCSETNANYRPKGQGGTGQYEWLESRLKALEHDPRQWKIVLMHAPMYSPEYGSCDNQQDAITYLKPLFDSYGVDIVFAGHEHYYARRTVTEIPYLILGGGGAGLGPIDGACIDDPYSCEKFDSVHKKYHYTHFDVRGDIMKVAAHDDNGDRFDYFTVDRTPKPDFDIDPENAAVDSTVKFTDTSTGNRYEYKWDFGDGTTHVWVPGSDASVEYSYSQEGTYTVTLTIKSAYQEVTKTCTNCVTVAPKADFDAAPLEGAAPLAVTFQDKSEGAVGSWLWNFGDGDTSTETNPVHTYNETGRHTVSLTVSNNGSSNKKTERDYVKVEPYAGFNYRMTAYCLLRIVIQCDLWEYPTTFANSSQGSNLTYHWDFGDGVTSSAENPTHTYLSSGERAKLTVTDSAGRTDYMAKYVESGSGMIPEGAISIDIMPKSDTNTIEITKHGRTRPKIIPVTILSDPSFDPLDLNTKSITFGRTGTEASAKNCDKRAKDVNGDGIGDLVCRFDGKQTGFQSGDYEGILRGTTKTDRRYLEGTDNVYVISQ